MNIKETLSSKAIENYHKSKNLFWCNICKKSFNLFFAFRHELPGLKNPFVKPNDGTPDGVVAGKNGRMESENTWKPGGLKPDGSTGK